LEIFKQLISSLSEARVINVDIGLFWTAVVVEKYGKLSCGLSASLSNDEFEHARMPAVGFAGRLEQKTALELANLVYSNSYTETGVGLAAINAMLPPISNPVDLSGEEYIARHGADSRVAVIGHFPFVSSLRDQVRKLWVLELNPREDDLPASAAPEIIPQADILVITASTLVNHTFESVFALRKPDAKVLLLGPSTPLSSVFFDYGVNVLSGSIIQNIDGVLPLVRQAATFRQIRNQGVRLVTIEAGH